MKKVLSLFLVAVLVLNSFGFLLVYLGEIRICEDEASQLIGSGERLSKEIITCFSKTENNDFILINQKEISFHGKLFDILKIDIQDGTKRYFAVSDEKEDDCFRALLQLERSNTSGNTLPVKNIVPCIIKFAEENKEHQFKFTSTGSDLFRNFHNDISIIYISPFKNIFSPPPENLFS